MLHSLIKNNVSIYLINSHTWLMRHTKENLMVTYVLPPRPIKFMIFVSRNIHPKGHITRVYVQGIYYTQHSTFEQNYRLIR